MYGDSNVPSTKKKRKFVSFRGQRFRDDSERRPPAPPTDSFLVEDVLTVKDDIVPLDGAHVLEEREVDASRSRVALADRVRDLACLISTKSAGLNIASRLSCRLEYMVVLRPFPGFHRPRREPRRAGLLRPFGKLAKQLNALHRHRASAQIHPCLSKLRERPLSVYGDSNVPSTLTTALCLSRACSGPLSAQEG